ncbi:hypothetical protein [Streptomyces sp. RPT161]|uniref:hypothetical protein n=1 Tax=Streptomyces sp. RPT161 TaxID=3015993 RepID=UPI0022B933AD|nr:hypothetical protein [Streptomyces sp. RPT161]
MQREGPSESGGELSTEDLVRAPAGGDETEAEAPTLPGESTGATPGTAETEEAGRTENEEAETTTAAEEETPALLTGEDAEEFRDRWQKIQGDFVDDPRDAVHAADGLVADVMRTLAARFAKHKEGLEEQWHRGGEVGTEDLRLALRHYRAFFNRLLGT